MTLGRLVFAGLRYHRGVHAMVILGVAVAVAVMAGALMVGASVRESLRALALARLGNTTRIAASTSFFRTQLATELNAVPLITMSASLTHPDSGRTAARVQVYGIDDRFLRFHGIDGGAPGARDIWISEPLAQELQTRDGEALLLRIAKPSDVPLDTLQGRRDQAGERLRMTVARVAAREHLGEFSLSPSQAPARTVFVALERLQSDLNLAGRVNTMLFGNDSAPDALRRQAQLEDYGLRVRPAHNTPHAVVESRSGVMTEAIVRSAEQAAAALKANSERVLVHLANTMRIGDRELPYSIVAGRAMAPGIALNEWAARDLNAKRGDRLELTYYVWSDVDGLRTERTTLDVTDVVPMSAEGGDPTFTPEYPGLTDADDISTWDPPFPVDLKRVRRVDEDYWDQWRASPKAFVPLETAQRLWGTSHGNVSSLRVSAPASTPLPDFVARLSDEIRARLDPAAAGFQIRDARGEALAAAEGTTDFGEYFFYFSFFLVVAGLLLAALFFALGVEQRSREVGVLAAVGFARTAIARVFATEAAILAVVGALIGVFGAVGYAAVIMYGLRTWWTDAVGTTDLTLHIDWAMLAIGVGAALAAATVALTQSLRQLLRRSPRALLSGAPASSSHRTSPGTRRWLPIAALVIAILLIGAARSGVLPVVAGFFGAGGLLMVAGLATFNWWLRRPVTRTRPTNVVRFGSTYASWRPTRSVLSAALITFACFVIVSVGAFRRDASSFSLERSAGTGGFALMAESVAPLLHNPNTASGRQELGLEPDDTFQGVRFARFRLTPGDEASCLTLYQPTRPRIIAPEPQFLEDRRFTFANSLASTPEERDNPWRLLARRFDDGAIPAVADQTSLTYVFHLKVGDEFRFTPEGGAETRLRIVGALSDSVLQSEVIIGEEAFVRLFPRRAGYDLWMVEAPPEKVETVATVLEDRLADFGVDVTDTRARLLSYHRVENTYLSTFQALGALGLIVGTLGIAAVLARNVLERRRELALLRAVGFRPNHVRTMILAESLVLVGAGVLLGTVTAIVAVLPAVLERSGAIPFGNLALLMMVVTLTATLSAIGAARMATSTPVVAALKSE